MREAEASSSSDSSSSEQWDQEYQQDQNDPAMARQNARVQALNAEIERQRLERQNGNIDNSSNVSNSQIALAGVSPSQAARQERRRKRREDRKESE